MKTFSVLCVLCALCGGLSFAGETKPKSHVEKMDFGPALSYSVRRIFPKEEGAKGPPKEELVAVKGLNIRVGKDREATVCFDTDLLRWAGAWSGGFLDFANTNCGRDKGTGPAVVVGKWEFGTSQNFGWSVNGSFADPRPQKTGPLPTTLAKWNGYYVHGEKVVLSYSVNSTEILECPQYFSDDRSNYVRMLTIASSKKPLKLNLMDAVDRPWVAAQTAQIDGLDMDLSYKNPPGRGHTTLNIPKIEQKTSFGIVMFDFFIPKDTDAKRTSLTAEMKDEYRRKFSIDLSTLTHGGPARWPEIIKTKGTLNAEGAGAYVIDTLTLPENNPWNSWMRPSGLDFFSDGRLAFCTLSGDVWILSGIDVKLEELSWKRFAAGLYEPLGLKIVDDKIYVLGRDQITRLHDLNGDNEADFYECFHALDSISPSYHAFVFDLQTDSAGNFYYSSCGNQIDLNLLPKHGCITKVSKDGTKSEIVCTGLRAPNGLCISPRDEITCSDNQGYWVCTSKINWIKPGGFYGHVADPRKDPQKTVAPPASFEPPLVWIPVSADNSSGGQVWVTSDKWGPYKDHLLHFSYGKCDMFAVLPENSGGVMQGGVVKFPLHFASGTMRARFNPKDGQLYVAGMKGWQTGGARDGCIQRVRYTGAPVYTPVEMHATPKGIDITFATSIDPASAADTQNFGIEQWNYEWTREYNAKEFSVADPAKKGRDTVLISNAKLSTDGKTVSLIIPDMKPVMQMRIKMNLKAADGNPVSCEVFNTINKLK